MIDEKSKEVYQRIKAPDSLKQRLMAYENYGRKQNSQMIRTAITIVASIAVITGAGISVPLIFRTTSQDIFLEGQKVGKSPVLVAMDEKEEVSLKRMQDTLKITLQVKSKKSMTAKVSEGILRVEESLEQNSDVVESGQLVEIHGDSQLDWVINGVKDAELTISTKDKVTHYRMYQDETSKKYYMKVKDIEKL